MALATLAFRTPAFNKEGNNGQQVARVSKQIFIKHPVARKTGTNDIEQMYLTES